MLLVHGEADEVVPVQRSREAEAALRAAGVPVEAAYVPRLGHGIDDTGLAMGALALAAGICMTRDGVNPAAGSACGALRALR